MIFDVSMEELIFEANIVADRHMIKTPRCQTYYIVVSRDTVRLALTIAALNYLQVKSYGVTNAYMTAPITETFWTVLGNEWVLMLVRNT